jgi:hypothetical protein
MGLPDHCEAEWAIKAGFCGVALQQRRVTHFAIVATGIMSKVKVLVCGDVLGHLVELETKVAAVNASHGPFAAVFCAGSMFDSTFDPICELPHGSNPGYHACVVLQAL